jgi:hypothetical protein
MKKITVITLSLLLLSVISPPGWILAQDASFQTGAVTLSETDDTSYLRAVFAQYLAVIPNEDSALSVNCAISISNVCASTAESKLDAFNSTIARADSGGFAIVLFDRDGTVHNFSSQQHYMVGYYGEDHPGDGILRPGQTFTVNLQEILAAVKGVKIGEEGEFVGYAWILSEFDCLAGTYSNTIYGLGFTQAFELQPAMGQGGFIGGIMLPED